MYFEFQTLSKPARWHK